MEAKKTPEFFSALTPPEGSGIFRNDSLPECMRTEAGFYSHFLMEIVPNAIYHQTWSYKDLKKPGFPRGDYKYRNSPLKDAIAYYTSTAVYHVEENGRWKAGGTRALFHTSDYSYDWIRSPNKAILLAFPLADYRRYPRLLIDTTLPVRGLYFPQLFNEPHYNGLSRVAQILFYKHESIYIPNWAGTFKKDADWNVPSSLIPLAKGEYHQMSGDKGLHYFNDKCLDIRVAELMLALAIPDYNLKFIEISSFLRISEHPAFQYMNHLSPSTAGGTGGAPYHQISKADFGHYHAWMDAHISKNEGIKYQFQPSDENTLKEILKNLVGTALGFIPFVGPLASISWNLVFDAIDNPDKLSSLGNLTDTEKSILEMLLSEVKKLTKGSKARALDSSGEEKQDDMDRFKKIEEEDIDKRLAEEEHDANNHALPDGKSSGAITFAMNL